jgi:hypothetical protein
MRLHLVTTAEDELRRTVPSESGLFHGTVVLQRQISLWAGSNRIVCGDSYFSSVGAATHLRSLDIHFIGVFKTATRKCPMRYLQHQELEARGDRVMLVHEKKAREADMMAVMWLDLERRYFIAITSSIAEGRPYERTRWRQGKDGPERVTLSVPQPQVAELYYSACAKIDRHNRCRQDNLMMERNFVTHGW